MSTRGLSGFKYENKYYLSYNHCDSYPGGLGQEVFKFIHHVDDFNKLKENVKKLIPTKESQEPNDEIINKYIKLGYYDGTVSDKSEKNWYCLLRNIQGSDWLEEVRTGNLNHFIDSYNFAKDSLFCEYGYIIDLDKMTLNCYVGFQKEPFEENEFGTDKNGEYYPIKLYVSISFDDIKSDMKYLDAEKLLYMKENDEEEIDE